MGGWLGSKSGPSGSILVELEEGCEDTGVAWFGSGWWEGCAEGVLFLGDRHAGAAEGGSCIGGW